MESASKTEFQIATAAGAGIVISIFAAITLTAVGGTGMLATFMGNAASGWVQAVGSLVAIAIAIWVPAAQARRAEEQRQKEYDNSLVTRRLTIWLTSVELSDLVAETHKVLNGTQGADQFPAPVFAMRDLRARFTAIGIESSDTQSTVLVYRMRRVHRDTEALIERHGYQRLVKERADYPELLAQLNRIGAESLQLREDARNLYILFRRVNDPTLESVDLFY